MDPAVQVALDSLGSFEPLGAILGALFRYALFCFADLLAPLLPFTAIRTDIKFDGVPRVFGEVCQFAPDLSNHSIRAIHPEFRFLVSLLIRCDSFLMGFDQPAKLILKRAEYLLVVFTQ